MRAGKGGHSRLMSGVWLWREVLRRAGRVRTEGGKRVAQQIAEMLRLSAGPGRLDPLWYFDLRLFDDARFTAEAKREFVGYRQNRRIDRQVNSAEWRAIADDKLVLSAMLQGLNLPTTRTVAMYRPGCSEMSGIDFLSTPEQLADYLRCKMSYPMFAKPVRSHLGQGAFRLLGYDASRDVLVLEGGHDRDVAAFAAEVDAYRYTRRHGYLFQEPIVQHPLLETIWGSCVGTLRMLVILEDGEASVLRTVLRIPREGSVTDNFDQGASGNMVGAVNLEDGTVTRVLGRIGLDEREIEIHPTTGQQLRGLALPHWSECISTVCNAAAMLPGLRFQHWDVAIAANGPLLVELNYAGGSMLHQVGSRAGLLSPRFRHFLEGCAPD